MPVPDLFAHDFENDPCSVGMRGIVPSLNTPFDMHGRLDEPCIRRLVQTTIEAGCQGMLAMAVAGEQASLSMQEKDRLMRIIEETAASRIPVIISVTSERPKTSLELARLASSAAIDGICCQVPSNLSDRATIDFFKRLEEQGPDLLMIQDLDWTGPGLPLDLILQLYERIEAFRCLKIETVPAGPKYEAVLDATQGQLHTSGGWAVKEMIDALDRGVHAFMPTALDHHYVAIYEAYQAGERGKSLDHFEIIKPILDFSNRSIDVSVRFFKMLRFAEGLFSTATCRNQIRHLSEKEHQEALRLISYALQHSATRSKDAGLSSEVDQT